MRFGSLFSGIGGFDLGLERAGMECAWQVEIDPKCREVLRRHWPEVPHHEDVTTVGRDTLGSVDLVCGGFPCQDLSVAGRRAGLAGERSGLFHEFMRVVSELTPRWVLIENVPGLLSSNGGRDMGTVLGALGGRGYGYAYRVLDSQFFGVAQRRRRVFIVGRAGGVCPPEVLFEPESLPGDSPPSREAREVVAGTLAPGAHPGGVTGQDAERGQLICGTLGGRRGPGPEEAARGLLVSHALTSSRSATGRLDPQGETFIVEGDSAASTPDLPRLRAGCGRAGEAAILAHTLRAGGHDASEDGTGRGTPLVATAFNWQSGGDCRQNPQEERTDALHAGQVPAVAFSVNQRREGRLSEVHGSLHEPSGTQVEGVLAFDALNHTQSEVQHTLRGGATGAAWGGVTTAAVPRRLTPRECERLQAFPDDWTRYDSKGREIADSPRYRMLGNAVTVSVAEWIGRRIMEAEATK